MGCGRVGCGRGGMWEVRCGRGGVWERCRWEVRWGVGGVGGGVGEV